MALTQMQIIQSLGDAMAWFERELNWEVSPAELKHLTGRIGELYAALITNGQMALESNQAGYDVVGENGDRVSVKTTTMMGSSGHCSFNSNTLDKVDRVVILRINAEEMQIEMLFNDTVEMAVEIMTAPAANGKRSISLSKLVAPRKERSQMRVVHKAYFEEYELKELENGTIEILEGTTLVPKVLPVLREIAAQLGIGILNGNGNPFNTRQLGSLLIKNLQRQDGATGNSEQAT